LAEGTAIEDLLHADRVLIGGKQTESGLKPFNLSGCLCPLVVPKQILTTMYGHQNYPS
jgi:UDPglucose 6-dehydrogenase